MALNLSTLTNPATSGDVLAEALTTADFLEGVPVLRNLARGSQKGGDAKQDTALSQPRALPLVNGEGYFYSSGVTGNYCEIPHDSSLAEMREVTVIFNAQTPDSSAARYLFARPSASSFQNSLVVEVSGGNRVSFYDQGGSRVVTTTITFGNVYTVKLTFNGTAVELFLDGVSVDTGTASSSNPFDISQNVLIGGGNTNRYLTGFIKSAVAKNASGTTVLNFDVNATTVRHGDTKFKCATGQVVTVNQSGNDPATIIKKPVLRFDGDNSSLNGLFANNISGGYMFAAFSVLGNGGEANGRVFGVNALGAADYETNSAIFGYNANGNLTAFNVAQHVGMFNDDNGDILQETKITNGSALSKVNNADKGTSSGFSVNSPFFNIATNAHNGERAALDLEYLALFPATITDAQADSVRNYINNRNNVFSLIDSKGYYFFDPQKATFTGNFTGFGGGNRLDGYITGSDNGDTDVRSNLTLIQSTENAQPSTDGYTITFSDAAEHLKFKNEVSQTLSGWQVVGTSLGTFAYRVNANAVTELNLLGNLGDSSFRKAGDLYGIILLPATATGKDIEEARKLLIDRGAADGASAVFYTYAWRFRTDIVDFRAVDMSAVTSVFRSWNGCSSMTSFGVTELSNCANFTNAWLSCSALTSFPAGAKLGTEANNVNFSSAWRSSGLTSFSTPLPTATNLSNAFLGCSSLESFSTPLPKAEAMGYSWYNCSSLTDFSSDVFTNWNPSSIGSGVFNLTWDGCTSLTAQSVENILTSIDASGKYATSTGASGGSALADAGIDIDYNVSTGSLSSATNTAVTSLKAKGWSIIVNNVTL